MFAIRVEVAGQNAGGAGRLQAHGTCAITKQHAGGAIIEIKQTAEDLGADHQRLGSGAGADHRVCHHQRIDKPTADRLDIECWAAGNPQFVLQDGRRRRKYHVRRGRGDDDQVNFVGSTKWRARMPVRSRIH